MNGAVYLDHNATAPVRPEAIKAVTRTLSMVGNPSSVHGFGRAAHRLMDDAREQVAALAGAAPEDVVFTGGGSEANNLAIGGCGRRRIVVSAVEHPSILNADAAPEVVPVDGDGVIDLDDLDSRLAREGAPALVSVMLANNETGTIQPVADVVEAARRHGALVHCDAAQAPGKMACSFSGLGVDMLTLSAHKMGGPQGIGALIVGAAVALKAVTRGGGQERGRRAGTESVPLIAGFGAAARAVGGGEESQRLARLRDGLEARLSRLTPPPVLVGRGAPRLPNTSCIAMPGVASETQVMALDLAGVAVSAGAACSSGKVRPSHVLRAMGLGESVAGSAIRVSLGWTTTEADVERFVAAWAGIDKRLGNGGERRVLVAPAKA
ncbi:MAG: cysteine desulfurase family protein [Rhodospirillales bacterium]|nr:cysteine desulfurase family protein [Rhodospirillales bacterium]